MIKRKYSLSVLVGLCVFTLYGSQPEQKAQEITGKAVGALGHTEQALKVAVGLAGRVALGSVNLATNYPRLTLLVVTVTPMVFPGYRSYMGSLGRVYIGKMCQWVRQKAGEWLLEPFSTKLDSTEVNLKEQRRALDACVAKLSTVERSVGHVYDDTQNLLKKHETLEEEMARVRILLAQHTERLNEIMSQESVLNDQVKSTHVAVKGLETTLQEQAGKLTSISDQEGATSMEVQKVSVSLDELYAQLAKLDGRVANGSTEASDKLALLERHLGELSVEQKAMFQSYGAQFTVRFDQLSENLRMVLASVGNRQSMSAPQNIK